MVFLTPTYPPDFGRLQLLRESMVRFGVTEEHLVLVDRADLAQARRALPAEGVTLLDKAALCPGRSRLLSAVPGPVAGRLRAGWWQQQFAKLNAGRALGLSSWLCLDSDTFLLGPISSADFVTPDGRLALVERVDAKVGRHVVEANRRSAAILRLSPDAGEIDRVWTGQCVPLDGEVAGELLDWLDRHYRTPWWLTLALRRGTEYALYGLYARHHHGLRRVVPVHEYLAVGVYRHLPVPEAAAVIAGEAREHGRRLAMVYSHAGYSQADLDAIAREVWRLTCDADPVP